MNWEVKPLSEIAELCLGKMLDQRKNRGELRPYLANLNVRWGGFDLSDLRKMKFEDKELDRYGLRMNDIVMCEGGEPGRCAIWKEQVPGLMIQKALHRIRSKNMINPYFLYYVFLLKGRSGHLDSHFTGSTIKHLPSEKLALVEVPVPPLQIQKNISNILKSFDDLIEVNERKIKVLEEIARRIYREWFVDFRFPGHEKVKMVDSGNPDFGMIPEGWVVKCVRDEIELVYGKALKAEDRTGGQYPVYGSGGLTGYHNSYLLDGPGIVLGRKGSAGSLFWADKSYFPIDTAYGVKSRLPLFYVYFDFLCREFIIGDTAVPGLNREYVYGLSLLVPSDDWLRKFSQLITPIFELRSNCIDVNRILIEKRDLLLPKLISGEIDVSDLNIAGLELDITKLKTQTLKSESDQQPQTGSNR